MDTTVIEYISCYAVRAEVWDRWDDGTSHHLASLPEKLIEQSRYADDPVLGLLICNHDFLIAQIPPECRALACCRKRDNDR